jgi:hypothetical protein
MLFGEMDFAPVLGIIANSIAILSGTIGGGVWLVGRIAEKKSRYV